MSGYIFIILPLLTACSSQNFSEGTPAKGASKSSFDAELSEKSQFTTKYDHAGPEELSPSKTQVYRFNGRSIKTDARSFMIDRNLVSDKFVMVRNLQDKISQFRQITRPTISELFPQGFSGERITDLHNQVQEKGIVDILLVVDNSGSMKEEQDKLAPRLSALLTKIQDANWKIAVTSTDATASPDSCDVHYITKADPNAENAFKSAVSLGISGSGYERGIFKARKALECMKQGPNPFLRSDSTLAVLIVSDEDNCSKNTEHCQGQPDSSIRYLTDYVEGSLNRRIGEKAGFYGIIETNNPGCNSLQYYGKQYIELIGYKKEKFTEPVSSRYGSICASDYSSTLTSISKNISAQLTASFMLSRRPDSKSVLEVFVNGAIVAKDYYDLVDQTLTFKPNYLPPLNAKIEFRYTSGATPKYTFVTLKQEPVKETIEIKIDGQTLANDQYSLEQKTIRFKNQPADNAQVIVSYRINSVLPNTYQLDGPIKSGSLVAKVGGKAVSDFTLDGQTLSFSSAPKDGLLIDIAYKKDLGPKLRYDLLLVGNNPRNFELYDRYGDLLAFNRQNNQFIIDSENFAEGDTIDVSYIIDSKDSIKLELPNKPISGSVLFEGLDETCLATAGQTLAQIVEVRCNLDDAAEFKVLYSYLAENREFELDSEQSISKHDLLLFSDGDPVKDFTLSGKVIKLADHITPGEKIVVHHIMGH